MYRYPTGNTSPFPSLQPNSASPSHGSSTCTSLPDIIDKTKGKIESLFIYSSIIAMNKRFFHRMNSNGNFVFKCQQKSHRILNRPTR